MSVRRRHTSIPIHLPGPAGSQRDARPPESPSAIDCASWLRTIERKRRLFHRRHRVPGPLPSTVLQRFTFISFKLEGILLTEAEIAAACVPGRRVCRPRSARRIRNHMTILRRIERLLLREQLLKTSTVVRWYTAVSAGLSTTMLADGKMDRLDQVVHRINSPHLRLQPALNEIVRLHLDILRDELVPSFNGILARLLLSYHLGRCALPPVLLDPERDDFTAATESAALARLLELIDGTYTILLRAPE